MRTGRARQVAAVAAVAVSIVAAGTAAVASGNDGDGDRNILFERLTGYQEDPLTISTTGQGRVRLQIDERRQEISYRLSYDELAGTVTQAHIHFGGAAQSGGIAVFLCSNLGNGPAGTQLCPAPPATVTGTIRPADVIGPAGQGIAPGEFAELIAAIHGGVTYANVHSSLYPGGEIRAQLGG